MVLEGALDVQSLKKKSALLPLSPVAKGQTDAVAVGSHLGSQVRAAHQGRLSDKRNVGPLIQRGHHAGPGVPTPSLPERLCYYACLFCLSNLLWNSYSSQIYILANNKIWFSIPKQNLKCVASAYFLCYGISVTTASLEGRPLSNQACSSSPKVGRNH